MAPLYEIEIYRLNVSTNNFTRIDVIRETFQGLQFFTKRNWIGQCIFTLNVYDPKATRENLTRFRNHIAIKRDGLVKWFGPITDIEGAYADVNGTITVKAMTMLQHLGTRFTAQLVNYEATDRSDLTWGLINTTQSKSNGSLGIIEGTLETSVDTSETYEYAQISNAISAQTNAIDGIDIDFTPILDSAKRVDQIAFNTFYPRQTQVRNDLPTLKIGQNIKSISFKTPQDLLNAGTALGAGTGTGILTSDLSFSSSQQGYSRREVIYPLKSISVPEALNTAFNAYLQPIQTERQIWSVTLYPDISPTFANLNLGDILNFDVNLAEGSNWLDWTGQALVSELAVSVNSTGTESVNPKIEFIN